MSMPDPATMSVEELRADIAARRERLAGTVDELTQRAHPRSIASRQAETAKLRFAEATQTPEGDLRLDRVGALAVIAVSLIALGIVVRRRS